MTTAGELTGSSKYSSTQERYQTNTTKRYRPLGQYGTLWNYEVNCSRTANCKEFCIIARFNLIWLATLLDQGIQSVFEIKEIPNVLVVPFDGSHGIRVQFFVAK
jgi:hypothetical protein